jgi:hypothetical protein
VILHKCYKLFAAYDIAKAASFTFIASSGWRSFYKPLPQSLQPLQQLLRAVPPELQAVRRLYLTASLVAAVSPMRKAGIGASDTPKVGGCQASVVVPFHFNCSHDSCGNANILTTLTFKVVLPPIEIIIYNL